MGTIVFVHGTGVRLQAYEKSFRQFVASARDADIAEEIVECAWGELFGSDFCGVSLPDGLEEVRSEEEADFGQWAWRIEDPLFELSQLAIRDSEQKLLPPGSIPEWRSVWEQIFNYVPSPELQILLERSGLSDFWAKSWAKIAQEPIARDAFEASNHELAEASAAFAKAVVAQLHLSGVEVGLVGPSRKVRKKLVDRLLVDWNQQVYGISDFFFNIFKRVSTNSLRRHRRTFQTAIANPIGDILLYQSHGEEIREFICSKVESSTPPVSIVAHSLGGVACVDLLALSNPSLVEKLVTVGSQAAFFYELGALHSLQRKPPLSLIEQSIALPSNFPTWLNIFDRNDFLSFVAEPIWDGVRDVELASGHPFPDSHSAYFANEDVWLAIKDFLCR